MRRGREIGLVFVIVGLITSLYALYDVLVSLLLTTWNVPLLVLGPCLMVIGALFRYTEEIEQVERRIRPAPQKLSNWRMRDLEYRLKKLEREEVRERKEISKITPEEFKKFKEMADGLLSDLVQKDIEEFSQSKEFGFYKKVMSEEGTPDEEKRRFILVVDKLLGRLPAGKMEKFVKNKEKYSIYHRVVRWAE